MNSFWTYLAVMAVVTYLTRMLPFVLVKKNIKNKFIVSFLYYVPYSVLSVMTIPAIFYAVENRFSALIGFLVAFIVAFFEKGLVVVAFCSCASVLISEIIFRFVL